MLHTSSSMPACFPSIATRCRICGQRAEISFSLPNPDFLLFQEPLTGSHLLLEASVDFWDLQDKVWF